MDPRNPFVIRDREAKFSSVAFSYRTQKLQKFFLVVSGVARFSPYVIYPIAFQIG